jgi:hypothetical protein
MSEFDPSAPAPIRQIILPRTGGVAGSPVVKLSRSLERLLSFWQGLGADGRPHRRALRPELLADILPGILLIDVEADDRFRRGYRYRYRLMGTAHREHNSVDLTGRYMDEHQPAERVVLSENAWGDIIERAAPGYWRQYSVAGVRALTPYHFYERVIVPFFGDAGQPVMLAAVFHWVYQGQGGNISSASTLAPGVEERLALHKTAMPGAY